MKTKIENILSTYKDLTQARKNTIIASILQIGEQALATLSEIEIKAMIDKLAAYKATSVTNYSPTPTSCERCFGKMDDVIILNDMRGIYCPKCRIAYPKKVI